VRERAVGVTKRSRLMSVQSNVIYNLNLQSKAVYCRFLQKQKTLLNVKKYK